MYCRTLLRGSLDSAGEGMHCWGVLLGPLAVGRDYWARGGHSHRLYSHSCDRSRSTVKAAQTGAVNGQSGSKVQPKTRAALFMATCRQVLQGQIADRSKVNGQKSAWSTVKTPKTAIKALTHGRSCDYSVYGSDPPLLGIYQALRYSGGGEGEGNSDDRWKCVIPSIKTFHII